MLILDLTRLLPGPLAGHMLAEIGYQVQRVLPPSGDLMAAAAPEGYAWLNDLKTSETVDLKSESGRARLRELVQGAVALLETNRPGVMERLGVGPDELRALNPALTYVRLAGYREPDFREQPGHDLAYLAAAGLLERFDPAWQTLQTNLSNYLALNLRRSGKSGPLIRRCRYERFSRIKYQPTCFHGGNSTNFLQILQCLRIILVEILSHGLVVLGHNRCPTFHTHKS